MAINSLYNEKRRRKVLQDVDRGQYEPRKRPQDAAAGLTEIPSSVAVPEAAAHEQAAAARMPVPPIPSQAAGPGQQLGRSHFRKVEPLVEGLMYDESKLDETQREGIHDLKKLRTRALFGAIEQDNYPLVAELIRGGVDVNAVEIEDGLVHRAGADPLDTVMFTWTNPLRYAEKLGRKEIEKLLIAHGARWEIDVTRTHAKSDDEAKEKKG